MDRDAAQDWLNLYVDAWISYDRADIARSFSDDVAYRYHPYDEPIVGRDAVVASWLGDQSRTTPRRATRPARTRPSTRRSRSTVTPWWPPARPAIATSPAGQSSAPTRTVS